jgi:hypothetical protein
MSALLRSLAPAFYRIKQIFLLARLFDVDRTGYAVSVTIEPKLLDQVWRTAMEGRST